MLVYTDPNLQKRYNRLPRQHPWGRTEKTPGDCYVNFRDHPELIADTLEDLRQFHDTPLEQTIISFISWANGSDSVFETNDFGLGSIRKNDSGRSQLALENWGRVTLLFRDLKLNIEDPTAGSFLARVKWELTSGSVIFKETD